MKNLYIITAVVLLARSVLMAEVSDEKSHVNPIRNAFIAPQINYNLTAEEPFYGLQFGVSLEEFSNENSAHSLFVGFDMGTFADESSRTSTSTSREIFPGAFRIENRNRLWEYDVTTTNLSLNYLYENKSGIDKKLGFYAGGGMGVSLMEGDASLNGTWEIINTITFLNPPITDVFSTKDSSSESQDNTIFFLQVFAGVDYNITEQLTAYAGARYQYLFDPDITFNLTSFGESYQSTLEIDEHNFYLDLGLRMRF